MTGCRGNFEYAVVAFGRPNAKSLLRQVAGIGLVACHAERELMHRLVITSHQPLKVQTFSHIATLKLRASTTSIVPGNLPGTKAILVHLTC
jgi:hypothetical protein